MAKFNIWNWSVKLLDHVQLNKCLCKFPSRSKILRIYFDVFQSSSSTLNLDDGVTRKKNHLLLVSIMQIIGEIYTNEALTRQSICPEISDVLHMYLSDEFWDEFMNCLKFVKEKHLVWAYIKSFCSIFYSSPEPLFRSRMQILLKFIEKNLFHESCLPILEFLTHLVEHKRISCSDGELSNCKNLSECKITSAEDLLLCFSSMLSQTWDKFVEQFHCITKAQYEIGSAHQFLLLWKSLADRKLGMEIDSVFFNDEYVLNFFNCAHNLPLLSCRLYVDVIIQIFYSNLQCKVSKKIETPFLESTVTHAIESKFLDLLPHTAEVLEFCNLTCSKQNEISSNDIWKCDSIIMQKVAFIVLNILTELENECLLCEALKNVLTFLKKNSDISSDKPVHSWVLDIFLNQDDILIGIMLVLLRIYTNLKEKDNLKNNEHSTCPFEVQLNLNPHKIFINFLQRLGWNHNELLSFLTSDETCFLLYLTEYLKLLLTEPKHFIEAHETSPKTNMKITELGSVVNSDISIHELSLSTKDSQSSHAFKQEELVSYSCSSSSDEDTAFIENPFDIDTVCEKQNTLSAILVLIKLKVAVIKLVKLDEFPYKASPLVSLLEMCEKEFTEYL